MTHSFLVFVFVLDVLCLVVDVLHHFLVQLNIFIDIDL